MKRFSLGKPAKSGGLPLIHTDTTDKPFTAKVAKVAKGEEQEEGLPLIHADDTD
jgi:hypothetical protein